MRQLAKADVNAELRDTLKGLIARLNNVADIEPSPLLFGRVQLYGNNRHYGFLLNVCRLACENLLADPGAGRYRFRDFRGDEREMGFLFQAFVRNFLTREQEQFVVGAEQLGWEGYSVREGDLRWLPVMKTDVSLRRPGRTVVIETKFYREPVQMVWGDRPTLRSDHLYQLFAYVKNAQGRAQGQEPVAGVLLYAGAGQRFDLRYKLGGHDVLVKTLDLDQSWQGVRRDLLQLVEEVEVA